MAFEIKEADWKLLRRLHAVAVERFCQSALEEISGAASASDGGYHSSFLKVFALVNKRDKELGRTFDNLRRSNALFLLAGLKGRRLLSEEEFSQFSPETQGAVEMILGSHLD
jgi:hypothetical protein